MKNTHLSLYTEHLTPSIKTNQLDFWAERSPPEMEPGRITRQ